MIPCETDLAIVDWSGIVHGAWHERGPEGMLGRAAGELLDLLAPPRDGDGYEVPGVVLATDAGLPTHRHELTAALDAPRRYKANRTRKPREFWPMVERLDELARALRIPTLAPEGFAPQTWEADDSAATACRLARGAGLSVLLVSRDKDWRQNVTDTSPAVRWYSATDRKLLDAAGVIGEHGVPPELLADWLALVGDSSDNVPGVEGIGEEKATALLKAWPSVAAILAEAPLSADELTTMAKALGKVRRDRDKAKKAFADTTALEASVIYLAQDLARWKAHAVVHARRAEAELSRKLVELRTDAPIAFDPDEALVGGWDVREVRDVLQRLGCGWLGKGLAPRPKRAPRRARGGAPAPRRIDGDEVGQDVGRRGAAVGQGRREVSAAVDVEPRVADEAAPAERPGAPSRPETEELGGAVHEGRAPALGPPEQVGLVRELPALPAVAPGAVPDSPGRPSVLTPASPWCCSFSRCGTDPVHRRIVDATAAIRDMPDAVRVCGLIQKSGMVELPRVEHARIAMDRGRSLTEGRAA